MILTFTHENKVDTGLHNKLHSSAETQLKLASANHSLLQLDNKKLPLGHQGLSVFPRGMSARFSQPVEVFVNQ